MRAEINVKRENGRDYEAKLRKDFRLKIDQRLVAVLFGLAFWVWQEYRIEIIITCLNRTPEENKAVGGHKYSAHLEINHRGADLRTRVFNLKQIEAIMEYLSDTWGDFIYVKYHDSGSGKHLHLNISWKYAK